jgi:NADH:ubiquinone reductase (H+-translocating)
MASRNSATPSAKQRLEDLDVEIGLGHGAYQIDANGVVVAGARIASRNRDLDCRCRALTVGQWLNVETDCAGRMRIQKDLTVPGHPEIFVIGDTEAFEQDGKPLLPAEVAHIPGSIPAIAPTLFLWNREP